MLFCIFISYFYAQNNKRKNPHTKPYKLLFLLCNNDSHSRAWSACGELSGAQPKCRYMKNILAYCWKI